MHDAPETQPPRIKWKAWHYLLMVLPGVVFLLSYPNFYQIALIEAREGFQPRWNPESEWVWVPSKAAVSAASTSGILALTVFIAVAFILMSKPAGRSDLTFGEAALAGVLMIIVNLILGSAGCSFVSGRFSDLREIPPMPRKLSAENEGVWRASLANGDKPGIGIELQRNAADVTCTVYLLDPDFPHDFAQGRKRPVTITASSETILEFTVRWSLRESENLRLNLRDGISGDEFRGELSGSVSGAKPEPLVFRRAEQPAQ
jgi:hypothetical protein